MKFHHRFLRFFRVGMFISAACMSQLLAMQGGGVMVESRPVGSSAFAWELQPAAEIPVGDTRRVVAFDVPQTATRVEEEGMTAEQAGVVVEGPQERSAQAASMPSGADAWASATVETTPALTEQLVLLGQEIFGAINSLANAASSVGSKEVYSRLEELGSNETAFVDGRVQAGVPPQVIETQYIQHVLETGLLEELHALGAALVPLSPDTFFLQLVMGGLEDLWRRVNDYMGIEVPVETSEVYPVLSGQQAEEAPLVETLAEAAALASGMPQGVRSPEPQAEPQSTVPSGSYYDIMQKFEERRRASAGEEEPYDSTLGSRIFYENKRYFDERKKDLKREQEERDRKRRKEQERYAARARALRR